MIVTAQATTFREATGNVSLGSGYADHEFPGFWDALRSFPEGLGAQPESLRMINLT